MLGAELELLIYVWDNGKEVDLTKKLEVRLLRSSRSLCQEISKIVQE